MDNQIQNSIVSFIWGIADDCLRDVYVRGKYRDVILPMTVIRRLDAMLEDTKTDVLKMKDTMDKAGITNQWPALCNAADQAFCNASPFLLKDLTSRAKKQTLKADFEAYLDGFSPNVQEILEKFKFRNQIDTMIDADILGAVIEKFVSPTINLSPKPVYTDDTMTTIKLLALDNHGMGTIFEELIRKFNEENNEEAGEHWTPRDVVELMADLIIVPVADQIMDATYSCYDGACGTGGMLTVAQDRLLNIAKRRGKNVSIHLFGQEVQPETYAICKADMLLKGDGDQADHIAYGSTLSADGNATRQFDFMLANPPYGKSWKTDAEKMGGKKDILDSRFNAYLEDGTQLSMIPRTSDGQLLFDLSNVKDMIGHIGKYMGLNFDEEIYTKLTEDYGGHPFLIRHICSLINKDISLDRPCQVSKYEYATKKKEYDAKIVHYVEMILGVLKTWYPKEYELLEILAVDGVQELKKNLEYKAKEMQHLLGYGIVKEVNENFYITINAVNLYLENTHKLQGKKTSKEQAWSEVSKRRNVLEDKLRKIMLLRMTMQYGSKKVKGKLLEVVESGRKEREKLQDLEINDLIENHFYLLDVKQVILKNWSLFDVTFIDKFKFENFLDVINKYRIDAHAKTIEESDLLMLTLAFNWFDERIEDLPV